MSAYTVLDNKPAGESYDASLGAEAASLGVPNTRWAMLDDYRANWEARGADRRKETGRIPCPNRPAARYTVGETAKLVPVNEGYLRRVDREGGTVSARTAVIEALQLQDTVCYQRIGRKAKPEPKYQ